MELIQETIRTFTLQKNNTMITIVVSDHIGSGKKLYAIVDRLNGKDGLVLADGEAGAYKIFAEETGSSIFNLTAVYVGNRE